MTFATKIKMRDLGKRRVTSASAEETEMAPGDDGVGGNWLTLYVEEINYGLPVSTTDQPSLSRFENSDQTEIYGLSETDTSGIKVPVITLRIIIDITTVSGSKLFAALVKMCKTKGVKEITGVTKASMFLNYLNYYDDYYCNTSKTAGTEAVTNNNSTAAAILDGIYVRAKGITIPAQATSKQKRVNLTLVETS